MKSSKEQLHQAAQVPSKLVPIKLDIEVENIHIRDEFIWNANEKLITPEQFAIVMICDLVAGDALKTDLPEKETAATAQVFLKSAIKSANPTVIPEHTQSVLIRHVETAIVSQLAQAQAAYGDDEDAMPLVEQIPEDFIEQHVLQDGFVKTRNQVERWNRLLEKMTPILPAKQYEKLRKLLKEHTNLMEELKIKAEVLGLVDPPEIAYNPGIDEEVRVLIKVLSLFKD